MEDKFNELIKIIFSSRKLPSNLRLFLITEKEYIRIYYGRITTSHFAEEYGFIRSLRFERGDILDMFSKLEFFVNELFQLKILGPSSDKGFMLDKLLENIDFFSRIRLLKEFGIIDGVLFNLLMQAKQVRNGFAHAWDENEVIYKGGLIKAKFLEFKQDMEKVWKNLLDIYKTEQEKIDIQGIINQLKELNSSSNNPTKKED